MCLGTTWYQPEDMAAVLPFMTAKPISYETFSFERQYPVCMSKGVRNVHPKGESSTVVSGLDV